MISEIGSKQNTSINLKLLKARQWRWLVASYWQCAQLALVIIAPLCVLGVALLLPSLKPTVSFLAVVLALLDVAWIDRKYRQALKSAARASELFDTELLNLPWNSLAAGARPKPEETDRAARNWDKKFGVSNEKGIRDWYSPAVDRASWELARAICQRTNLSYDNSLRNLYINALTIIASIVIVALISVGMLSEQTFGDFITAGWVLAAPFAIWAIRERFRQADAIDANNPILIEAEKLIESIINTGCSEKECQTKSRELQNAIFNRRSSTVLLFPGIYKFSRPDAERDMHASADYWLNKAGC
ncbi:S-4TM family putative pore-forming effector [Methylobacterium sp. 77]|uniref:S-4TM family putative pore-forming effector n=1 Tax=Methylobacterium sp. 77 TaxID=1101192 RepID=UPI002472F3BA|nr:S-4TM family putative pore-forming effector [Methylobacterium sp. 77]